MMSDSDEIIFAAETSESATEGVLGTWEILIADDDQQVHLATRLVLADMKFDEQPVSLFSTYSAQETNHFLTQHPKVAVVLLDVVMETEDSGLVVAKYIRQALKNNYIRIILRTGQPGQAPERRIIDDYEINDYKEKSDLTAQKLYTTIKAALRSYRDILAIDRSKRGLENIIKASYPLFQQENNLERFMAAILEQMDALLQTDHAVMYVRNESFAAIGDGKHFEIVTGRSAYAHYTHHQIEDVVDENTLKTVLRAVAEKHSLFGEREFIIYFQSKLGFETVLFIRTSHTLTDLDKDLLQLYSTNITLSFDNLLLSQDIVDTQKEIVYSIGELIETRSKETGRHVKRVTEYSILLAKLAQLSETDVDLLANAVPLHDVGKIGIPDSILCKSGPLSSEEFDLIKDHTLIGYHALKTSQRPILRTAALIARDHHERWDGQGYPQGLQGDAIGIMARITALSDVFDALSHERCYKAAWSDAAIAEYLGVARGTQFDPDLTDLFLKNLESFIAIRNEHPD